MIGCRVGGDWDIFPWLIMHSGAAPPISRFHVQPGRDGKTTHELARWCNSKRELLEYCERVQFIPVNSHHDTPKADDRAWEGAWIGVNMVTDEHLVGTRHDIYTSRTVRRKPANEKWSATAVIGIRYVPWRPVPDRPDGLLQPKTVPNENDDPNPDSTLDPEMAPQRFRSERKHLEKYHYTSGCPGCYAERRRRAHREHTVHCPQRIRQCIPDDPEASHLILETENLENRLFEQQLADTYKDIQKPTGAATPEPLLDHPGMP